jgi:nucleoside-diphosphate-sugar epimerase
VSRDGLTTPVGSSQATALSSHAPVAFLTGGTGFVGSHVARVFLARGWRVRALVRRPERRGLLPLDVEVVPGDLLDAASYRSHLKDCAAVLHCAGATRARRLVDYELVNVAGTARIAEAARASCPSAMFVHVSSQAAAGPSRNGRPVRDVDPPAPISWYGRSKLDGERALARCHPGPWCIVRPSVVYGPGDLGLLQMFSIVARGLAPILAGGRRRVQLLAAGDLAELLFAVAQRPDLHGRCGFAAGDTVSMGDLVREIATLRTPPARTVPIPEAAVRALGFAESVRGVLTRTARPFNADKVRELLQSDWLCDGEPLRRELNIAAVTDWKDGIRQTCRWYVQAQWLTARRFAIL